MISSYFKNNFQILYFFSLCSTKRDNGEPRACHSLLFDQIVFHNFSFIHSHQYYEYLYLYVDFVNSRFLVVKCQVQPLSRIVSDQGLLPRLVFVLPIISGFFKNPDFSFQSEQKLFKTATQNTFVSLELNHYHSTVSLISLNLRTFFSTLFVLKNINQSSNSYKLSLCGEVISSQKRSQIGNKPKIEWREHLAVKY